MIRVTESVRSAPLSLLIFCAFNPLVKFGVNILISAEKGDFFEMPRT